MSKPDYDFDAFDEDAEAAAIAEIAAQVTPHFIISEGRLVTRFPDGKIIKTPINISYENLTEVLAASDDASTQYEALLSLLGDTDGKAVLAGQGLFSVTAAAQRYFQTWEKVQKATLGESKRSSN